VQTFAEQLPRGDGAKHWIETDARTGQSYLKLPVPEPAALERVAKAMQDLLSGLRAPSR
jgi:hypothetical protein